MRIIFLFSTLLFCASLHGQVCLSKLTGHVHSSIAHENLHGASVRIVETGKTAFTNVNGDFTFDSLCSGGYTLLVSHVSYDTLSYSLSLAGSRHIDLDLKPGAGILHEVTVTTNRNNGNGGMKKELSGRALEEARGFTLGDALRKLTGVTLLQRGTTISKPILHGLHSNRILTINNGVRQEGQQWGNEHAPEIDPFIAAKLTVIKGVDELRYGSDAVGGVILVDPRPLRASPGYNAEFNAMYFTNNRQYVASGIFEQQLRRLPAFTYRLQGSFKKGANISTPNYRLNNTAVEEYNFSVTTAWRKEHFNTELYFSSFNTRVGIFSGSHIGNDQDLLVRIEAAQPYTSYTGENSYRIGRPSQEVAHNLVKWKTGLDIKNHRFSLLVAGQYNRRKEFDVIRNSANDNPQLDLKIYTLSQDLTWEHPRIGRFSGMAGIAAMQQNNSYSGRYLIPNFKSYSFGAFFIEKWSMEKWDAQAGLRFDHKNIDTRRLQSGSQVLTTYSFDFSTLASSLNVGYRILPEWKVNAAASLATRAPHVNELLTNGIHHGAGTYEIGDIGFKPERSFNLSLNNHFTSTNRLFSAELTVYRNRIDNFIYQQPKPGEPVLTTRGKFPLIRYVATDALLQGIDLSALFNIQRNLSLISKYSMVRARNRKTDDWIIGMPGDRIGNELSYTLREGNKLKNSILSIEAENVLKQTRVPGDRNERQDYTDPPPAYVLINASVSTSIEFGKIPFTFSLVGRNLLNNSYREYLNSFRYYTDEIGRNLILRVKINLEQLYQ